MRIPSCASLVASLVVALACSDPKPTTTSTTAAAADASTADSDSQVALEVAATDIAASCPGGAGCACTQNSECESGFCLDTQLGKVCAQKCIDTCPAHFACSQVPGAGGDLISLCVERFGHLCDPCTASSQCVVAGQADPRCISYGKIGAFCGSACAIHSTILAKTWANR